MRGGCKALKIGASFKRELEIPFPLLFSLQEPLLVWLVRDGWVRLHHPTYCISVCPCHRCSPFPSALPASCWNLSAEQKGWDNNQLWMRLSVLSSWWSGASGEDWLAGRMGKTLWVCVGGNHLPRLALTLDWGRIGELQLFNMCWAVHKCLGQELFSPP